MHITFKSYQTVKFKNDFVKKSLLIIFHCAKLNFKKWMLMEQKLKKLKLNSYKPLNKMALKELKNSIYFNYSSVIKGFILLVSFKNSNKNKSDNLVALDLNNIQSSLKPLFVQVSLKLNNKLYSFQQAKKCQKLFYKENIFKLHKVLNKSSKMSYMLIKNH